MKKEIFFLFIFFICDLTLQEENSSKEEHSSKEEKSSKEDDTSSRETKSAKWRNPCAFKTDGKEENN